MSTAQFGREIANDRIARLIEEARASDLPRTRRPLASLRLARALRRLADRLDPAAPQPTRVRRANAS